MGRAGVGVRVRVIGIVLGLGSTVVFWAFKKYIFSFP